MEKRIFLDLDGTVSDLNSTFDFIAGYLRHEQMHFRLIFAKIINHLLRRITILPFQRRRIWMVNAFFLNLNVKELETYTKKNYLETFMSTLTSIGKDVASKKINADVLLTGCTEIPARIIAKELGIKEVVCSEFDQVNGVIKGIKKDTFGNLKKRYVRPQKGLKFIYYTDDPETEMELYQVMDEIIVV